MWAGRCVADYPKTGQFCRDLFVDLSKWETVVAVQSLSHVWLFETPSTTTCQLPCPSLSPGVCSNSCPLSHCCHLTILSSVSPFPTALSIRIFSQHRDLFQWVSSLHQVAKIGTLASASVLPVNSQDWFPLGLTGLSSLQSKGLSRVLSSTTGH